MSYDISNFCLNERRTGENVGDYPIVYWENWMTFVVFGGTFATFINGINDP